MLTDLIPAEVVLPNLELDAHTLALRDELAAQVTAPDVSPLEVRAFLHRLLTAFCQDGAPTGLARRPAPHHPRPRPGQVRQVAPTAWQPRAALAEPLWCALARRIVEDTARAQPARAAELPSAHAVLDQVSLALTTLAQTGRWASRLLARPRGSANRLFDFHDRLAGYPAWDHLAARLHAGLVAQIVKEAAKPPAIRDHNIAAYCTAPTALIPLIPAETLRPALAFLDEDDQPLRTVLWDAAARLQGLKSGTRQDYVDRLLDMIRRGAAARAPQARPSGFRRPRQPAPFTLAELDPEAAPEDIPDRDRWQRLVRQAARDEDQPGLEVDPARDDDELDYETAPSPAEPLSHYALEAQIARLQAALHPVLADPPAARPAVAADLEQLAREWLGGGAESWSAALEQADGDTCNLAVLAAWLAHLCRATRRAPATLAAYRSAGCMLVRHLAGRRWAELDEEDVHEIASLPLGQGTRATRLTVLGQVVTYLREALGVDTVLRDQAAVRLARQMRPVNLIGQPDVIRLLAHLAAQQAAAQAAGRAEAALRFHHAYLTVLLAYFWGLRRSEGPQLLLGDLVLDAQQPYLRVRRAKRGRSRVVWARHVPPDVLDALRAAWQRRWTAMGADPGATFLEYEGSAESAAEALGKTVNAAIRDLGLAEEPGALPVTLHTLRHAYANRLLVWGVPLLDITRSLGHADPDTTTGAYLHAFDWLQRERLAAAEAARPRDGLTAAQIGGLLGIQRPAVLAALGKLPPEAVEDWWDGDRHVYSWGTVARLVAGRLKMGE